MKPSEHTGFLQYFNSYYIAGKFWDVDEIEKSRISFRKAKDKKNRKALKERRKSETKNITDISSDEEPILTTQALKEYMPINISPSNTYIPTITTNSKKKNTKRKLDQQSHEAAPNLKKPKTNIKKEQEEDSSS